MTGATANATPLVVASDADVVKVRQAARDLAVEARLSIVDQTKLVTATSELARNTLVYGGGGEVLAARVERAGRTGVELVFSDDGPGIPDVELALTDGWTSGNGMGLGLSGTRRLVDEFEIDTSPGQGTRVRILKWRR
ncbi:anti-sigma regulatory factor [Nocardioides pyridinolyticus]